MRIQIDLVGTSPLVMHNVRLSDPGDKFAAAIKVITDKSEMTTADYAEKARLEFMGGLYVGKGGLTIPAANVHRCFNRAATIRREGKNVERALVYVEQEFPLLFIRNGEDLVAPKELKLDELWADEQYRFQTAVRVGQSRVQRTRPRFTEWAVSTTWELVLEAMDLATLKRIVKEAGVIEGLGDHRTKGSGRFEATVTELKEKEA